MIMVRWLLMAVLACATTFAGAQSSAQSSTTPPPPPPVSPSTVKVVPSPQSASSAVLAVRVEAIGPVKLESDGGSSLATVAPYVSSVIALVGVFAGLWIASKNTQVLVWQKANEAELAAIQAKLDGFYLPFWLLSKANHLIALDVKSRQKEDYRLLVQLFDRSWRRDLSNGDKKLVEMICNNALELRSLIETKAGLVDGTVLEYLSRASVHFKVLHSAFKNELGVNPAMFSKYVYPRELDDVLQLEIARLRRRAQELRDKPGKRSSPPEILAIPTELKLPAW